MIEALDELLEQALERAAAEPATQANARRDAQCLGIGPNPTARGR